MCNTEPGSSLIDIRNIYVEPTLSKEARIIEYVRQIRNPYHFKCGSFTVTAQYAANGPTLEDRLQSLIAL